MRSRTGAAVLLATAAVLIFWQAPRVAGLGRDDATVGTTAPIPAPSQDDARAERGTSGDTAGAAGSTDDERVASGAGATAEPTPTPTPTPPANTVLVLGSVFFPSNQRVLGPDATRMLDGIAATYKGTAQQLEIVGHADARGSVAANLKLSADRAEAVRAFLAAKGVPAGNMHVMYDGARTPMARGVDPEANAQNRRVEIRVPRP